MTDARDLLDDTGFAGWPAAAERPPVERRQSGGAGFTDSVVRALVSLAAGGTVADANATAALEAAAGSYARAFAVADVTPANAATAALTPEVLALLARDLIRRGEAVHVIEVDVAGVRLVPAGSWDVRGGPDRADWTYQVDLFGPSGNETRYLPAAAVVHARYSTDPARPWFGISPLGWATLTGRLHAALEDALADEAGGTRGHLLPVPAAAAGETDEIDPATGEPVDPNARLRADILALRGRTVTVETTRGAYGEGREAQPWGDWRPSRLGANPPASLGDLRSESARAVLGATGCPPGLFEPGDSTGQRESWRRFLHGSVQPLARLLAVELASKLEVPDLALSFDGLFASDLSGRARAFQSLVGGGMDPGKAAALAGLMEAEE